MEDGVAREGEEADVDERQINEIGDMTFTPGKSMNCAQGGGIRFLLPDGRAVFEFFESHYTVNGERYSLDTLGIDDAARVIRALREFCEKAK